MKKFKSFLYPKVKPFINMHGSHALPRKKVKKVPFINQHGSHAKPVKEDQDHISFGKATRYHIISTWHDGSPEGKMHLEKLQDHFLHNGNGHRAFDAGHDFDFSPYDHDVHALHIHMTGAEAPKALYNSVSKGFHIGHMTSEQHTQVALYNSSSYALNHTLVNSHGSSFDDRVKSRVHHLDTAIAGAHHNLGGPLVTFHGTRIPNLGDSIEHNPIIHSRGYTSSSTCSSVAHGFGDTVLAIHSPTEHRMLPVNANTGALTFTHEMEMLHPRGLVLQAKAKLTHWHFSNPAHPRHFIHADVIGVNPGKTHEEI